MCLSELSFAVSVSSALLRSWAAQRGPTHLHSHDVKFFMRILGTFCERCASFLPNTIKMLMLCFFQGSYTGRAGEEEKQKLVCISDQRPLPKHCFTADSSANLLVSCRDHVRKDPWCHKLTYCASWGFCFSFQGSDYQLKNHCKHPCAPLSCWKHLHHILCGGSIPKVGACQEGTDSLGKE